MWNIRQALLWSSWECILLSQGFWKPSHTQFWKLPKIFTTKFSFYASHFPFLPTIHLYRPLHPFFFFFFPFPFTSPKSSQMGLKSSTRGGGIRNLCNSAWFYNKLWLLNVVPKIWSHFVSIYQKILAEKKLRKVLAQTVFNNLYYT